MKIVRYKKNKNGKYTVFLDDGRELVVYEDVILKFELLLKKEIHESALKEINDLNLEYEAYYVAIQSINSRFKSIYELKLFLIKKEFSEEVIDKTIDKLLKQGYLDDRSFTKSYINTQILTTSHGPIRIKNDLLNKKVDVSIIEEELSVFDEDLQCEKMDKIIKKIIASNRNRGGVVLKQKIINDLKHNGYEFYVISKVINNYDFSNNLDIAKKEYNKLYKKYSKKYQGNELDKIIKEKLFLKGLRYEDE